MVVTTGKDQKEASAKRSPVWKSSTSRLQNDRPKTRNLKREDIGDLDAADPGVSSPDVLAFFPRFAG